MPSNREVVLCRYRYDPLDRLTATAPLSAAELQRFYCKSRLATEIQGQIKHSIFQHDDQLLAQQQSGGNTAQTTLLATDQQRSVLHMLDASPPQPITYSPYGHRPADSGLLSLLGFNGERRDPVTGHYLLGNGYRAFNPVLMRFNSPDSWSPFGDGGLNPYAYCLGDPVNRSDPMGHTSFPISFLNRYIAAGKSSLARKITQKEMNKNLTKLATTQKDAGASIGKLVNTHPKIRIKNAQRKIKNLPTMLEEGNASEHKLISTGQIQPLALESNHTVAVQKYYELQNSGMSLNSAGIPNPKAPITTTNASGLEQLRTDFYDTTINYAHYEAANTVAPTYKAQMEQLAGEALIKRRIYIRRYENLDY